MIIIIIIIIIIYYYNKNNVKCNKNKKGVFHMQNINRGNYVLNFHFRMNWHLCH